MTYSSRWERVNTGVTVGKPMCLEIAGVHSFTKIWAPEVATDVLVCNLLLGHGIRGLTGDARKEEILLRRHIGTKLWLNNAQGLKPK